MNIECILQRDGGTFVELPGKTYHFAPSEDGRHVAEVTIEAHAERFLSIPEAYRLLRTSAVPASALFAPQAVEADLPVVTGELAGSVQHPASFDVGGVTYSQSQIVARAFADSGMTAEDWNELDDDMRGTKLDIVLDALDAGEITIAAEPEQPEQPAAVDAKAERAALAAQYEAKFGKKPANTMSLDKIRAKLAE